MSEDDYSDDGSRQFNEDAGPSRPFKAGLGDSADIWSIFAMISSEEDKHLVEGWERGLDTLALFSGLFSAVTSAFIIESYKLMQPDYTELLFRATIANASNPFTEKPFHVPVIARLVNCLWICSLVLALSAALIAIMGKDWIAAYSTKPRCNKRQWAELRTYRLRCVDRWHLSKIIATAPLLLHTSLILFCAGLVLFILPVDEITGYVAIGLCALVGALYSIVTFSSVVWNSSPYRSAATIGLRRALHICMRSIVRICCYCGRKGTLSYDMEALRAKDLHIPRDRWSQIHIKPSLNALGESLTWLSTSSPIFVITAIADLDIGREVALNIPERIRNALIQFITMMRPSDPVDVLDFTIAHDHLGGSWDSESNVFKSYDDFFSTPSDHERNLWSESFIVALLSFRPGFTRIDPFQLNRLTRAVPVRRRVAIEGLKSIEARGISSNQSLDRAIIASNAWRRHFATDASLITKLLYSLLTDSQRLLYDSHKERTSITNSCNGKRHCDIIELLSFIVTQVLHSEDTFHHTALALLVYFVSEHEGGGYHPCIIGALGDSREQSPFSPEWSANEVASILEITPSPEQGNLDIYARMLGSLLSPQQTWFTASIQHASPGVNAVVRPSLEPFFLRLAALITAVSSREDDKDDNISRERTACSVLHHIFSDARCFNVSRSESVWDAIIPAVTFFSRLSCPQSDEAKALFLKFSSHPRSKGAQPFTDYLLTYIVFGSNKTPEPFDILVLLKTIYSVYPEAKCWIRLKKAVQARAPSGTGGSRDSIIQQFFIDLESVPEHYSPDNLNGADSFHEPETIESVYQVSEEY